MTSPPTRPTVPTVRCSLAVVIATDEAGCSVASATGRQTVRYAGFFPSPRVDRVHPGNLVALAAAPDGAPRVVWRWFDAVVVGLVGETTDGEVDLWEPGHGRVGARLRRTGRPVPLGSRVYTSAGLPGADWWAAGPVVAAPEEADVDLGDVEAFLTGHGLWDRIA